MKKNLKIVSLAAAALLAVAPVVSSTVPVSAADNFNWGVPASNNNNNNNSSSQTPSFQPYFSYNGFQIGQASSTNPSANVVATNDVKISADSKGNNTVQKVADEIKALKIEYHATNNSSTALTVDNDALRTQLYNNGVRFESDNSKKKDNNYYTIKTVPANSFNLTVGVGSVTIQIPVNIDNSTNNNSTTPTTDADAPVITYTSEDGTTDNLNGAVFQVTAGSQFNPTNFTDSNGDQVTVNAVENKGNNTSVAIKVESNPVNTSEAGRYYNVTVSATGATGKKTTATFMVLTTSSHKQTLYTNGADAIPTYRIYGNNVLNNGTTFKNGAQVYVANGTKVINKISYSKVSTKSKAAAKKGNTWVQTSALTKPAATQEAGQVKMVMHDSEAYDKNGKALNKVYENYTNITIVPKVVTINGKTYYKVANKDEYVRVTNITGTARVLRHNAYVYRSSYRRADSRKLYKGSTVITYGGSYRFKNGKRYWRIGGPSKQYVKCANF